MSTGAAPGLHPCLRGFPGAVLEVGPDGRVLDSNGRLEQALERGLVGAPLAAVLDEASRRKWERMQAEAGGGDPGTVWELMVQGRDTYTAVGFSLSRTDDGPEPRLWLVEVPRDPRARALQDELAAVYSEQAATQRQLAKEKARLSAALADLERELRENESLSERLQQQNVEVEAQNEELLTLTGEMHEGQERLLLSNHQMERRTRELQVALSARNRFYAAMSHELRTPINAVMGYNDLLLAGIYGDLGEQQELAVERAQAAARHLRKLVADLLDISRIEAGGLDLARDRVQVAALVEEILVTLRPEAESRGTEMRVVVHGRPEPVETDTAGLRQVLLNLLTNAVKFGAGKPVWIHCAARDGGGVVVEVVDGGPGIAPEDLGRIFDEFVQLGRDENGEPAQRWGTGLGLSIARRMATLLGARLEAASTPGVGSTFRLTLPPAAPGAPGARTSAG